MSIPVLKSGFDYCMSGKFVFSLILKAFHLSCVRFSVPCYSCYIKVWL